MVKSLSLEIYQLLYTDEDGEVIGLDEVQLLDPPLMDRVPDLIKLLSHHELFISYQSAIILASRGIKEGIEKMETLIDSKIHLQERIDPDRINGKDKVYDNFAEAIDFYELSGGDLADVERLYTKILKLFPYNFFRGRIQVALLSSTVSKKLLGKIIEAFEETMRQQEFFQASMLLLVITKIDSNAGLRLIDKYFFPFENINVDAMENVAEAMQYVEKTISLPILEALSNSKLPLVVEKAQKSLNVITE